MDKKKIMIVDDNVDLCEMYKITLEIKGYDVLVCNDGLQALSKMADYKPDLILLDIMMPRMNGIETLESIKINMTLKPKIIVFSNFDSKKDIDYLMELGADKYVFKSKVTPTEIFMMISAMIGV